MDWTRRIPLLALLALLLTGSLLVAEDRITAPVESGQRVVLQGHRPRQARLSYDRGPVDPSMELGFVTLLLKPAPSLAPFLVELQTPSSASYHRWLTPEQFADRFGLSEHDIASLVSWLESQGLQVNDVARGRHWITFGGTADQVGRALHTEIHRYQVDGEEHFANATDPEVPAAFANVVGGFTGLDDFGPQPLLARGSGARNVTLDGSHSLVPDDLATIYDIRPFYGAGIDGSGQKLAIAGSSTIDLDDLRAFRKLYDLPARDPQLVRVGSDPGSNPSAMAEADLDLEWSGAVARNATLIYVYSQSVNTAVQYAIDQNLAPLISLSYGACELENSIAFQAVAQQANAQGITIIASSGDQGAAACDSGSPTEEASKGPTVTFPASLPEVTAVGGTTFSEGSGNYWSPTSSPGGGAALSYIPEVVWNDSAQSNGFAASGGGASGMFSKPPWQIGRGVPDDDARDLPDVAFAASALHDGYSIVSGGAVQVVGGTSAAAPVFAGMIALLEQYLMANGSQSQAGLGNINPTLYRLAQGATGVFHDITTGSNQVPCQQGTPGCSNGLLGYVASPGYDLATGLGSADVWQLATQWNHTISSITMLTASPCSVGITDTVQLTARVRAVAADLTPTGTVAFVVNDVSIGTAALTPSGGTAIATQSVPAMLIAAGNGTVTALYSGDGVLTGSSGSATVTLTLPASGSLVVPSVNPNPVYEVAGTWLFTLRLTEKAGVATTLTGVTLDNLDFGPGIFGNPRLPALGTLQVSLGLTGINPPAQRVFVFSGIDANGRQWTERLTVPFLGSLGPPLAPAMTLTSMPATVFQNPSANPSCQWSLQLTLEEEGGYLMELTRLSLGTNDFSSRIQALFGTTRIAPYGILQGNLCFGGDTAPAFKNYQITGLSPEFGKTVTATSPAAFGAAAPSPASFSVSSPSILISMGPSSPPRTVAVSLNFLGGSPDWSVSVLPGSRASAWLAVTPPAGKGSAQLGLTASATGLSNGVYTAILAIQSTNAIPQVIDVPVTLVVSPSSTTEITGVVNAASLEPAAAPGMLMTVYGSHLAPSSGQSGVSATVNGITAPVLSFSPTQLTIQVPYETGAGMAVLGVNNQEGTASFWFPVAVAAPGIFGFSDASSGRPVTSAAPGQLLTLAMTGDGDVTPFLATGATPSAATSAGQQPRPRLPVTVSVGGTPANIDVLGVMPGSVGITRINFAVPSNAPTGVQPVIVTVGNVASPAVNLNVAEYRGHQ